MRENQVIQDEVEGPAEHAGSPSGQCARESDDIVECGGYHYFPSSSVRLDRLEKAGKTGSDRACPHGVQFYDAVIDGVRHPRVAWAYEFPRPAMEQVAHRFGFWGAVEVA